MIAALAKAITLYLAPLLALTAIVLSLLAFLAPAVLLHDKVALLTVTPSQAGATSQPVDGPSLFLGVLGSCARSSNAAADVNCTTPSISPIYDSSLLPTQAPQLLLTAPPASTPVFIAIAISFSILFFFIFTLTSFRHKLGEKMSAALERPFIHRAAGWIGFLGFFIGITSFLIARMWFGKAADDFNRSIELMGSKGPQLVANLGNSFTMVWVAYAFYAVPLIVAMSKMNLKSSKA